MNGGPRISVVIPARNAERYLAAAIESVLAQDYRPLEIVVVDDGSEDGTARIAHSFGSAVRCASIGSSGAGTARNHGVEMSRGEVIGFLDADDLWQPGKLQRQLPVITSGEADIAFGLLDEFVSPDLPPHVQADLRARAGLHPAHVVSAMLVSRATFERVGAFVTHLAIGEFVDWIARAKGFALREQTIPHHVLRRRVHGANATLQNRASLTDLAHALKPSLDRRRIEGA